LPNIKSAKKRVLITERNRQRNVAIKSEIKTAIRKTLESIKAGNTEETKARLNKAYSVIDKAVSKGILHKNTAARKKGRLTRHVNRGTVPAK